MAYSKVILNGTTLMDVTNDSVAANNLLDGETATMNNGLRTTGTVVVPTKTSDLTNDSGFITSAQAPVQSVNGATGAVTVTVPTKTSDLTNDSGFVTSSGVTGVVINTTAEPYDLPITNGNAKLDIGDGLSVSDSSGVELKHATGAGWKHIPSGGSSGQFLGYSSSGTASWQTPPTPTVPTKTSDLTNDSGFITSAAVPPAATANPLMDGTAAVGSSSKYAKEDHVHPTDTSRQEVLVSGTNLKTINNESLLGSGNIDIQGGGGGGNNLVLYANKALTALYLDAGLTTQLNADYYEYDSTAAYTDLQSYDTIKIIENPSTSTFRTLFVTTINFDPIEYEIQLTFFRRNAYATYSIAF